MSTRESPTPRLSEEELKSEAMLRPKTLDEFVGQPELKANLSVFIKAAKQRGDALDHAIFYGPPGLGKTTLALIVANELGVPIKQTSGPAFQNSAELLGVLSHVETNQVVFIDEIHRLPRVLEEHMYQAMDSFRCELIVDKGPNARHYTLNLQPFTLIGATTRVGMITAPLRDRFGVVFRLDYYTPEDLKKIVVRSSTILDIAVSDEGATEIRAPRRAGRRGSPTGCSSGSGLRSGRGKDEHRPRDGRLRAETAQGGREGLDEMDRRILSSIVEKFGGGPVGVGSLAVAVSEEVETIEDVYEPFLIQQGFLQRTPRGRIATPLALAHLGLKSGPATDQTSSSRALTAMRLDAFDYHLPKSLIAQTPLEDRTVEPSHGRRPRDGRVRARDVSRSSFVFDAGRSARRQPVARDARAAFRPPVERGHGSNSSSRACSTTSTSRRSLIRCGAREPGRRSSERRALSRAG